MVTSTHEHPEILGCKQRIGLQIEHLGCSFNPKVIQSVAHGFSKYHKGPFWDSSINRNYTKQSRSFRVAVSFSPGLSSDTRLNHLCSVPGMAVGTGRVEGNCQRHATLCSRYVSSWEAWLNSSCHYQQSDMDFALGEWPKTRKYMYLSLSKYVNRAAMMRGVVEFLVTHFADLQSYSRCKSLIHSKS